VDIIVRVPPELIHVGAVVTLFRTFIVPISVTLRKQASLNGLMRKIMSRFAIPANESTK
jgi:hypothetical protein